MVDGDAVVYRAPRITWRTVFAVVLGAYLVLRGALTIEQGYQRGLIAVVFFGFLMVLTILSIVAPPSITLTSEGLRASRLGRTRAFSWRDCSDFQRAKGRRSRLLVFTERTPSPRRLFAVRAGRAERLGGNRVVTIPTGLEADELLRQIHLLQQGSATRR